MTITLLLFASLKDVVGASQLPLDLAPGSSVSDLLEVAACQHPRLLPWLPHVRVAVNSEYAQLGQLLNPGDEVAALPPVSGGAQPTASLSTAWIVERPIGLDDVVSAVEHPEAGAICTFLGVVRSRSIDPNGQEHHDITELHYEAYQPMARNELAAIAGEAQARWGGKCAVVHRIGRVEVGQASVAIAVATPHREQAFVACRYIIDQIKVRVPIWKREMATSGAWWSEGISQEQ